MRLIAGSISTFFLIVLVATPLLSIADPHGGHEPPTYSCKVFPDSLRPWDINDSGWATVQFGPRIVNAVNGEHVVLPLPQVPAGAVINNYGHPYTYYLTNENRIAGAINYQLQYSDGSTEQMSYPAFWETPFSTPRKLSEENYLSDTVIEAISHDGEFMGGFFDQYYGGKTGVWLTNGGGGMWHPQESFINTNVTGIHDSGIVIGGGTGIWNLGTDTAYDLDDEFPNYDVQYLYSINRHGQILGRVRRGGPGEPYTSGIFTPKSGISKGYNLSLWQPLNDGSVLHPTHLSDVGYALANESSNSPVSGTPMLLSPDGKVHKLNGLLSKPCEWDIKYAFRISSSGRFILARSVADENNDHHYLVLEQDRSPSASGGGLGTTPR